MILTPNYSLQTYQSDDIVNVMTVDKANMEAIDTAMHNNQVATIGTAVELTTGNVHALTRSNTNTAVFRFTATSNYTAGDTFVVDTTPVLALLPSGGTLPSGAYIVGSEVLCALRDNLLTVYVSPGAATIAEDSEMLGGQLPEYYATATAAQNAMTTATAAGELAQANATRINGILEGSVITDATQVMDSTYFKDMDIQPLRLSKYSNGMVYFNAQLSTRTSITACTTIGTLPVEYIPNGYGTSTVSIAIPVTLNAGGTNSTLTLSQIAILSNGQIRNHNNWGASQGVVVNGFWYAGE